VLRLEPIAELQRLLDALRAPISISFQPAVDLLVQALASGKKILMCGNGGSWCDAAHFAAELSVRYHLERRALAAICLTDTAALTACANDYGYERVFSRQVEALGQPGDVLVSISTSGKSKNVHEAILAAKFRGLGTLGLSGNRGFESGPDVDLVVPSTVTARIQECHQLMIHMMCEAIEERLPKGEDPKWKQT
jgi:D-sedoheptulose 7-phosphate isomerase